MRSPPEPSFVKGTVEHIWCSDFVQMPPGMATCLGQFTGEAENHLAFSSQRVSDGVAHIHGHEP